MNPGADRLPGEVLEKIFSYLPCQDLVDSVQFVCTWWQQVSWEKSLWKYIMYSPGGRKKNVVQRLKILPQLRILNLISATIDNDLIQFITDSCPNLEHLYISWDSIYNNSHVTITHPMSQIKILTLPCHQISHLDFPYLDSAFPKLESLNIPLLSFNREDLELYLEKKQDSLHTLRLPCRTKDGLCVLPCLSVCRKLTNLSLYKVCDKVLLKEVGYLPNISYLTLHGYDVRNVSDSSAVFCSFPNITTLVLVGCSDITENVVCILAHNCPQLQKFKFSSEYYTCFMLSYNSFERQLVDILQVASHLERLTHLYIHKNDYLTDESLKHLRLMPQLIHLDLYQCKRVTTGCLKLICGFSKLEVLKFDLRNKPLPADLSASDVKNKNLQLMFYNCQDVSSLESLRRQHLRVCLTRIHYLNLSGVSACCQPACSCFGF